MTKMPDLYLGHMLDAITAMERHTAGMSFHDFERDEKTLDAVYRRLEILGEAAKRLSLKFPEVITEHPEIPWREIVALRNLLIHDYDAIIAKIVWDTIQKDIPLLKEALQRIISQQRNTL